MPDFWGYFCLLLYWLYSIDRFKSWTVWLLKQSDLAHQMVSIAYQLLWCQMRSLALWWDPERSLCPLVDFFFLTTCAHTLHLSIKSLSLDRSRINCTVNFPVRLFGHPPADFVCFGSSFCFSLWETGWGASACMDHLPWDSGQRRMWEGKMEGKKTGWGEDTRDSEGGVRWW